MTEDGWQDGPGLTNILLLKSLVHSLLLAHPSLKATLDEKVERDIREDVLDIMSFWCKVLKTKLIWNSSWHKESVDFTWSILK